MGHRIDNSPGRGGDAAWRAHARRVLGLPELKDTTPKRINVKLLPVENLPPGAEPSWQDIKSQLNFYVAADWEESSLVQLRERGLQGERKRKAVYQMSMDWIDMMTSDDPKAAEAIYNQRQTQIISEAENRSPKSVKRGQRIIYQFAVNSLIGIIRKKQTP